MGSIRGEAGREYQPTWPYRRQLFDFAAKITWTGECASFDLDSVASRLSGGRWRRSYRTG
jgi:hypothetical protein